MGLRFSASLKTAVLNCVPDYLIHAGNVLDILPTLPSNHFAGSLSDPPYELGFMNKKWDNSGIAFNPVFWAEMYRVLKPGAYVMAFGGTRTHHRLMVAIEDAGFEIRDCLQWLYATGFPKSRATLKPSWEPVILARKPDKKGKLLNIEECRINPGEEVAGGGANFTSWRQDEGRLWNQGEPSKPHSLGRWPPNVMLDEHVAELVDAQSGPRRTSKSGTVKRTQPTTSNSMDTLKVLDRFEPAYGDTGGASRFFYCPKASKKERNAGLDSFTLRPSYMVENGGKTAGTNGKRHDRTTHHQNPHPCVKPLQLTKWLATLIKPEEGGTLLVPFSGSGSEMIGGLQAGWDEVIGVELTAEYIPVAHARIEYHQGTQAKAPKTQAHRVAGRRGGLARTKAKVIAARLNGAKGGRPRKQKVGPGYASPAL